MTSQTFISAATTSNLVHNLNITILSHALFGYWPVDSL